MVLQPLQLIFYGDDVTVEQYQGDCEHPGCAKGPAVFKKYFGEWRSAAFGITGVQSVLRARACSRRGSLPHTVWLWRSCVIALARVRVCQLMASSVGSLESATTPLLASKESRPGLILCARPDHLPAVVMTPRRSWHSSVPCCAWPDDQRITCIPQCIQAAALPLLPSP